MIYVINLPRSGGQTMLQALSDMFPRDGSVNMWHSVEPGRWGVVNNNTVALVEVYAPISWCVHNFTKRPHRFIIARRSLDQWYASCLKMLPMAIEKRWRHPLWSYDTSQWINYYYEFYGNVEASIRDYGMPYTEIDPTDMSMAEHADLCQFLDVPTPRTGWPNIDRFARSIPQLPPKSMDLETSIMQSWMNPLHF